MKKSTTLILVLLTLGLLTFLTNCKKDNDNIKSPNTTTVNNEYYVHIMLGDYISNTYVSSYYVIFNNDTIRQYNSIIDDYDYFILDTINCTTTGLLEIYVGGGMGTNINGEAARLVVLQKYVTEPIVEYTLTSGINSIYVKVE